MKMVIQRVKEASVTVDGSPAGAIGRGLLVLLGAGEGDDTEKADVFIRKLTNLRIFEDEQGKTNLSCREVDGSLLIVSQFTLYADCRKGNRPGFSRACDPEKANALYEYVIEQCRGMGFHVECGVFGAHMEVTLTNDGPFTIILDDAGLGLEREENRK